LYGIKISTDLFSVLSHITRVTDRRTDGRTEFSSLYRVCITCSAVKTIGQIFAVDRGRLTLTPCWGCRDPLRISG